MEHRDWLKKVGAGSVVVIKHDGGGSTVTEIAYSVKTFFTTNTGQDWSREYGIQLGSRNIPVIDGKSDQVIEPTDRQVYQYKLAHYANWDKLADDELENLFVKLCTESKYDAYYPAKKDF